MKANSMRGFKPTQMLTLCLLLLVCEVSYGQKVQVKVGLVVRNTEDLNGKKVMTTLDMALADFYANHSWFKTRLLLHHRSSESNVLTSASVVVDLIKKVQVVAIIGPETSMEAHFDISLGDKAHVPIITYSATSPFLVSLGSDYFIQATQVDDAQVQALASIVKAFRWRQVVPIYVDNDFGGGLIPTLVDALEQIGTRILHRTKIPSSATDDQIVAELNNLKSMPTRVFIVHMMPDLGARLFSTAMKLDMMSKDYVWIITNGIGNMLDTLTPSELQAMQGVVGVRTYIPRTKELDNFVPRWKRRMIFENPEVFDPQITVFELYAYDAITALARAVEDVVNTSFAFEKTNASSNSSDLSTLGVSKAGEKLVLAIRDTRFIGLSGDFLLVDGQLNSSILEIVNIFGKGEKVVGVWTPRNGFLRGLNFSDESTYSVSKERLGSIMWPGENNDPPKGWVTPTNGKKLRVLVPIKKGFNQFVHVKHVPGAPTEFTGYCIDIFDAVMKSLPYPVSYEYIAFDKPDGSSTSDYDELISEVYFQRYDAAMGDISIVANRSLYVDYTFPYTEAVVTMVAPIEDKSERICWVFFKPLSWELWLVSLLSLVFFGISLWFIERDNPDLRNLDQSLFFSFAMVVFAHGNTIRHNLARFLVIIWMFFMFILTQSYTANLASMLTVNRLNPKVSHINELIKAGAAVGYQEGSFVQRFLINKGITNLKNYSSIEELQELLAKGSDNGGIAAAFDETPYMKVFLASSDNCRKYMMVPPSYSHDGFGFVFPLGSPLVSDVSRQVLQVREGEHMVTIEKKWFGQQPTCPESSAASIIASSSLTLETYGRLFVIMLSLTVATLIVFIVMSRVRQVKLKNDQPGNGQVMPQNDQVAPGDGQVVPQNDQVAPGDGQVLPQNDQVAPGDGQLPPRNGQLPPRNVLRLRPL